MFNGYSMYSPYLFLLAFLYSILHSRLLYFVAIVMYCAFLKMSLLTLGVRHKNVCVQLVCVHKWQINIFNSGDTIILSQNFH